MNPHAYLGKRSDEWCSIAFLWKIGSANWHAQALGLDELDMTEGAESNVTALLAEGGCNDGTEPMPWEGWICELASLKLRPFEAPFMAPL